MLIWRNLLTDMLLKIFSNQFIEDLRYCRLDTGASIVLDILS